MPENVVEEVLEATTAITDAETTIGTIPVGHLETLTLLLDYINGDETTVVVTLYFVDIADNEYQEGVWSSAAGAKTFTANSYTMNATAKRPIVLDVSGIVKLIVKSAATGSTATGTLAVRYEAKDLSS